MQCTNDLKLVPFDWLPLCSPERLAAMIRSVDVINVVLGFLPISANHLVEHVTLRAVREDVLTGSIFLLFRLLPYVLVPSSNRSNPNAPIESFKPFYLQLIN